MHNVHCLLIVLFCDSTIGPFSINVHVHVCVAKEDWGPINSSLLYHKVHKFIQYYMCVLYVNCVTRRYCTEAVQT